MPRAAKGGRATAPPGEVVRNLMVRYMERNRDVYVEEFREAILA
jgi:hypothetical protein